MGTHSFFSIFGGITFLITSVLVLFFVVLFQAVKCSLNRQICKNIGPTASNGFTDTRCVRRSSIVVLVVVVLVAVVVVLVLVVVLYVNICNHCFTQ